MFTPSVLEKIGYYVYFLQDPRSDEVFYIGKGVGNRVFNHLAGAIDCVGRSTKLEQIRDIVGAGYEVKHMILRHGLTEPIAFELEAALIDFVGMDNLTNLMGGHYSGDYGIKSSQEIIAMYDAEVIATIEPVLLLNVNKDYRREITVKELYEISRLAWLLGARRENVKYAIPVYRGLTREVYEVRKWFPVSLKGKTRWGFKGRLAKPDIRETLRYKSTKHYFKRGVTNPVKYLNC